MFTHPILLSSIHLMEDTSFFSSVVLCANWTSSPLYGQHTGQTCCGLLDTFLSSERFSGIPLHSIRCIYIHECDLVLILCIVGCQQDYPSSRHRFLSRFLIVVLLSSLHKHTAFNYLPSSYFLNMF